MAEERTTIWVSTKVWKELPRRKERPGESYDNLLVRVFGAEGLLGAEAWQASF